MREKKETLEKNNDNLKLKKIAKKQKMQERGITLIALVVTIIILLILAGVTLNIALSDNGLFNKTKKAAEEYKQAQSEEEDLISQFATQMYSEYVGATVEGYSLEQKTVTINGITSGLGENNQDDEGNTIVGVESDGSQTFTTETNMKWRVWDFDGNILRIIGDSTSELLTLKGAAGYNNGVWALDHICNELYSNGKKGVKATNLKRTDIQKVSTYDYTKYGHFESGENTWDEVTDNISENVIYFGEKRTFEEGNNQYPKMWEENDKEWTYEYDKNSGATGEDKECKKWEEIGKGEGNIDEELKKSSNLIEFKESFYHHRYWKEQNEFITSAYFNLIKERWNGSNNRLYWLATRETHIVNGLVGFGLDFNDFGMDFITHDGGATCNSKGDEGVQSKAIRPIVSIDLKNSGYKMESTVDEDGKMTITLS